MNGLTSSTVLDLWEAGLAQTPAARAELLLRATGEPDVSNWPVGRRDVALLQEYVAADEAIAALADCPVCGAPLEVSLDPSDLAPSGGGDPVTLRQGGYVVTARPPTVADLQAMPVAAVEVMRAFLLQRCVVEVTRDGSSVTAAEIPGDIVALVEEALDAADPAADIRLALTCAECGATWDEPLDPVTFAWSAVEGAARRLATDVHTLARAYGWTESEILGLSPFRRHLYLSAVGS